MSGAPVLAEHRDGVLWLTLNRPERRNALDTPMAEALRAELDGVARAKTARAVVLTGAGDAFCAGGDLSNKAAFDNGFLHWMRQIGELVVQLHHLAVPTVAAVNGPAYGLGANLALACDLTFAAEKATFCEVFSLRGLAVDGGGTWLLPRLVGAKRAKELAFLGDRLSAAEALEFGLVNRVVPDGDLGKAVIEVAQRLATGATLALSLTKAMLNRAFGLTLEEAVEDEARSQAVCVASADAREGFAAFVERRPPEFTGA